MEWECNETCKGDEKMRSMKVKKMEGNECARDENTWDGTQPLRFKSHKMNR